VHRLHQSFRPRVNRPIRITLTAVAQLSLLPFAVAEEPARYVLSFSQFANGASVAASERYSTLDAIRFTAAGPETQSSAKYKIVNPLGFGIQANNEPSVSTSKSVEC
jgi:hypothetical protein